MTRKLLFGLLLIFNCLHAQKSPLWLRYPSISPDGSSIVFSWQGDLFKVSSSGGMAVPLTLSDGHDMMPVWSHDGKQIAFASDRYGNFDIFVMPATGGTATRLTYHSSGDFPSDFSADDKQILFSSVRMDAASNAQFPNRALPELYSIPVNGGNAIQLLTTPAEETKVSKDGKKIIFIDRKGYEDVWRKHHTSSVTRDIWMFDFNAKKHTQLTTFAGEDRNPIWNGDDFYYLSEQSGTFNVHKSANGKSEQVTDFKKHPVRFLSMADNGMLCFTFDGEIYTMNKGGASKKVDIQILSDDRYNPIKNLSLNDGITEFSISPNGKEFAFVNRGEIFVSTTDGSLTQRITNTASQERSVAFSPDGKSLVYAYEDENRWTIRSTKIVRKDEPWFYSASELKTETLVTGDFEAFQPSWSPDGKEVAYLENRTTLKVLNLESKKSRLILDGKYNYSYSDGDQTYQWSPDGKWFLVSFLPENVWIDDVGLVSAAGDGKIVNLTESGYDDGAAKWSMGGKAAIWFSDRHGMKNHGSWGAEYDVYAMFFDAEIFEKFKMTKEELNIWKEIHKDDKKDTTDSKKPLDLQISDISDRKVRLSLHSSALADAILNKDGDKMFYLAKFEKGFDLWVMDLREKETKISVKLNSNGAGGLQWDKDFKTLFLLSDGKVLKIDVEANSSKTMSMNGEMRWNAAEERAYLFEHSWRQVVEKFYRKDIQNVDWASYKKAYVKFLPHINNNFDFAEMMSELLGELNASHTGCRYTPTYVNPDVTASLGLIFDYSYPNNQIIVKEVIAKGPAVKKDSKIVSGVQIESIDGVILDAKKEWVAELNRKAGKWVLVGFYNPSTKDRWTEKIKAISPGQEAELLYLRWVAARRAEVDKLSNGTVGYMHVRGMNDESFRAFYEEVLGKHPNKKALIVDTRFNGGGWLHEDLVTFLTGKKYVEFEPRGQKIGFDAQRKWTKPSCVLAGEGNYSDAHFFPYAYKALKIGPLIGMPVPGTATAVWWEKLMDPSLVFGIPQVGVKSLDGYYLENTQLEPDVKVANEYDVVSTGRDQQIEKAVEVMKSK